MKYVLITFDFFSEILLNISEPLKKKIGTEDKKAIREWKLRILESKYASNVDSRDNVFT